MVLARKTLALALLLAVAGCHDPLKCKKDTALVTVEFDAATRAATTMQVTVTLDHVAQPQASVAGPRGKATGTLEITFPSGYSAGKTLEVAVIATSGAGVPLGGGSADFALTSGCSAFELPVTGVASDDLDMAISDGGSDMTLVPTANIAATPDIVGYATALDGSSSSDPLGQTLTYAWAVKSAPAGSTITTTSLTATEAPQSSFMPDFGGNYQIELTVTATDGRSGTTVATVTVPTVPLFYSRAADTATTYSLSSHVMSSDGTGDHSIGCDFSADGGVAGANVVQYLPYFAQAYEPPTLAGTPLFAFFDLTDGTGKPPKLVVGNAKTNCATSPPVRVDNNVFTDHLPSLARFSPDGTRIVYVDLPVSGSGNTYRLVTVSSDGTGPVHVVRSSGYLGFAPAIWVDNSTVAWVENDANVANPFTIFKAADANAAGDSSSTRTQILRCDQSVAGTLLTEANQFAVTPFGMVVAGSTGYRDALENPPLPAIQLYKLPMNDCSTANAVTLASEQVGGLAWDFALSPDGLTVLFSSTGAQPIPDGGAPEPQSDIFLAPSDGSSMGQKFLGDPAYNDVSPRYIAAGRQILWSRTSRQSDMGADVNALMIANADGTHVRALVPPAAAGETVRGIDSGTNHGIDCDFTPGAPAAGATAFALLMLGLLVLRLRRRS